MCTQTSFRNDEILPSLREQNSANGRLDRGSTTATVKKLAMAESRPRRETFWGGAGGRGQVGRKGGGKKHLRGREEERFGTRPPVAHLPTNSFSYLPVHLPTYLPIGGTVTDRTVGSWNCSWSTYSLQHRYTLPTSLVWPLSTSASSCLTVCIWFHLAC